MKDLLFQHTFYDGRVMSITVKRSGGLPELVCEPKFCGAENERVLYEYAIWRDEIFTSLIDLLEETELIAVITLGANSGAA